jgi:hypothetical protein
MCATISLKGRKWYLPNELLLRVRQLPAQKIDNKFDVPYMSLRNVVSFGIMPIKCNTKDSIKRRTPNHS